MRSALCGLALLLLAFTGCEDQNATPGGPGVTREQPRTTQNNNENTFKLDAPNLETEIQQGEIKKISIGIDRGDAFKQDVRLQLGELPKGVTVEPSGPMLLNGQDNVEFVLRAAPDATMGHFVINVTGTPTSSGATGTTSFKLEVQKAD